MSAPTPVPARAFRADDDVTVARHMTWANRDIHDYAGSIVGVHGHGQGGHRLFTVEITIDGERRLIPLYENEIRPAGTR